MLDENVAFSELQQDLRDISQRVKDRFPGHSVTVGVGRRILDADDMCRIRGVMEGEYGLEIKEVWCDDESLTDALEDRFGVPVRLVAQRRTEAVSAPTQYNPVILRGTCRSGTTIHHRGDVVVLGDVNSGAEISAAGDVVIYGALRGAVHAGAFESVRFKIGPHDGGMSPRDLRASPGPEIARVKNGAVVVERYDTALHRLSLA